MTSADRRLFSGRRAAALCALAMLLGVAAYRNALRNPFVYDDHVVVLENPSIEHLTDLPTVLLHDIKRPITNLSYAVDYAIWGFEPFGFHLTNLLLHLLNIALLFTFARRAARDLDGPGGHGDGSRELPVAFAAAALLAVHPLMTQAVGYVAARADLLCATFLLVTFRLYRHAVVTGRRVWFAASAATWAKAVAAKETAALLPPILFLYDWLVLGEHGPRLRRRVLFFHLPLTLISLVAGLLRVGVLLDVEYGPEGSLHLTHALVEADVVRHYLSLLAVPIGQSVFHPVEAITSFGDPRGLFALAWIAALVVVALRLAVRDRLAAIGVAWFLLLLIPPAILVIFDLGEPMAEHRVYAASIGMFLTVGCLFGSLWRVARRGAIAWRVGLATALGVLLATLGALTVARNHVWSDPVRLWTEATEHAPDIWVTHLMLGQELQFQGRCDEALRSYEKAMALRPQEPFAYLKSGVCLTSMGRFDEATRMFERLRAIQPKSSRPLVGLGIVSSLTGRHDEARRFFLEAVDLDPGDQGAHDALAKLEASKTAIEACRQLAEPARTECLARTQADQLSR